MLFKVGSLKYPFSGNLLQYLLKEGRLEAGRGAVIECSILDSPIKITAGLNGILWFTEDDKTGYIIFGLISSRKEHQSVRKNNPWGLMSSSSTEEEA